MQVTNLRYDTILYVRTTAPGNQASEPHSRSDWAVVDVKKERKKEKTTKKQNSKET